jgi:hypothetical protein
MNIPKKIKKNQKKNTLFFLEYFYLKIILILKKCIQ